MIVVACNAASAAALQHLREQFPGHPSWAWNRRSNPPPNSTRTGVVGVLATPATFQGALYASVVERFASGVTVLQDTCPGLVGRDRDRRPGWSRDTRILEDALLPMLEPGHRYGGAGLHPLPLRHPADPADRRAGGARDRPRPGHRPPDRACAGFAWHHPAAGFPGRGPAISPAAASAELEKLLPLLLGEKGTVQRISWDPAVIFAITNSQFFHSPHHDSPLNQSTLDLSVILAQRNIIPCPELKSI